MLDDLAAMNATRFAETGEGQIESDPPYYRLRAGLHDAMVRIDRRARTLAVLRIYRARR